MRAVGLLLQKDLRVLGRSPLVVGAFVLYPLLVAVLVGLVVRYAAERPSVAFVDEDNLPRTLAVGGQRFDLGALIDQVSSQVDLVSLSHVEAEHRLRTGEVNAAIIVPPGFTAKLRSVASSPRLVLESSGAGLGGQVEQRVQALVYSLNLRLQKAYIASNLRYVQLLRTGGRGSFLGNEFDIVGLEKAGRILGLIQRQARDPVIAGEAKKLQTFVDQAQVALGQTGSSMRAVANPIRLETKSGSGRTWLLSAQVQAYALALALSFACVLIAAAAIAGERDENVLGRLARGLVRLGELVAEKITLVSLVAVVLGLVLAVVFGVAVQLGDVVGGEPWQRLPLLVLGLLLAGAAFGAFGVLVGVLARDGRTAALVAFFVALPLVLLGLVPSGSVPAAGWVSLAYPFVHAVRFFRSALYDLHPWATVARELGWLAVLALGFAAAARIGVRRLLT
ncbi:MAG: hypothetical protein E6G67_05940 [Actinobacteria bacterium]|nr:MAG: hypothetical protein E6G67_05940 [Actinomycetota bacterium]